MARLRRPPKEEPVTSVDDESDPGARPVAERTRWRWLGPLEPWLAWFGAGRVAGVAVTVVVTVIGGWWLLRPAPAPTEAVLPYASSSALAPTPATTGVTTSSVPSSVVVHVAGAVAAPGVYELAGGARVVDGVERAGGPTPEADTSGLNLASVLVDGQRVYVPRVGETPPPVEEPVSGDGGGVAGSTGAVGPIDVNAATASELEALPGIGPATAAAIVQHREDQGPFASVDDLDAVRGIGPAKLAALRDLVTT
jgi:competence protein ComEA